MQSLVFLTYLFQKLSKKSPLGVGSTPPPLGKRRVKPQVTQILPKGFSDLEFETTNKIFISVFVQKLNYCLNNKIDAVRWADHNFFNQNHL